MDDPSTPELKRLDRVLGWSIALAVVLYVVGMALLYVPDVVGNGLLIIAGTAGVVGLLAMAAVAVRDRRWDHVAFFAVLYPSMAAGMALVPEDWPMWKALALAAGVVAAAKAAQVLVHRKIREAL